MGKDVHHAWWQVIQPARPGDLQSISFLLRLGRPLPPIFSAFLRRRRVCRLLPFSPWRVFRPGRYFEEVAFLGFPTTCRIQRWYRLAVKFFDSKLSTVRSSRFLRA